MADLFSGFSPLTAARWKEQIQRDLKGGRYEDLIWKNENGFDVQPFYTPEDLSRTCQPAFHHADWEICASADESGPAESNARLLRELMSGASSVRIRNKVDELGQVLQDVTLDFIHTTIDASPRELSPVENILRRRVSGPEQPRIALVPRSLATAEEMHEWFDAVTVFADYPGVKFLAADVTGFHHRNCTAAYELALLFGLVAEQLESGHPALKNYAHPLVLRTGVSADFFVQMAKLRAIRRLWEIFRKEYKTGNELFVSVETSLTNKTVSDRYNNLLRSTVEAMAAVAGGCNELLVREFDLLYPGRSLLSQRMAINQQLILKEEASLDRMADVACGSYYIETLTDQLAIRALEIFKDMYRRGGFFACLADGSIGREIRLQHEKRRELVFQEKQLAIGVNIYRNPKEEVDLSLAVREHIRDLAVSNPALEFELETLYTA